MVWITPARSRPADRGPGARSLDTGAFLQHLLRLRHDALPDRRHADLGAAAFEQGHAQLVLELADGDGKRGLTDETGLQPTKMALACHRHDVLEFGESHTPRVMRRPAAVGEKFRVVHLGAQEVLATAHPARQVAWTASGCSARSQTAASRASSAMAASVSRSAKQQRHAGLPRARIPGAALLQVAPGDLEAVGCLEHGAQARARSATAASDRAARRPIRQCRALPARAAGAAGPGRSARRARSPSSTHWARPRPPR